MHRRAIPLKTKLIVLSQSGGRCSMPDCNKELTFETDNTKGNLSNFAHIEGYSPEGPRYNPNLSKEEVNSEENLMVLCLNCHKKIDADTETYTVEKLKEIKKKHINKMRFINDHSSVNFDYNDLLIAANTITDYKLPINKNNNEIEDYSLIEIESKIIKNNLSTFSKEHISKGMFNQELIENFFVEMSRDDDLFFDKVSTSLKNCYNNLKENYSGDSLFLELYKYFKKELSGTQQSACLGIIVYFFTICELFEK